MLFIPLNALKLLVLNKYISTSQLFLINIINFRIIETTNLFYKNKYFLSFYVCGFLRGILLSHCF